MKVTLAISIYAALAFNEHLSDKILSDSSKTSDQRSTLQTASSAGMRDKEAEAAASTSMCTPDDEDRYATGNQGTCCNEACHEPRPETNEHYCAEGAAGHGTSCWSMVWMCRAACPGVVDCDVRWSNGDPSWSRCTQEEPYASQCVWGPTEANPSGQCQGTTGAWQNHLDITPAVRDACVSGAVSGRSALTDGAACSSETNVTCAAKYEQKARSTHRVGQDGSTDYSASYDLVGELHLCEWRPELNRCEAGKVLTVCPEDDHVVEVASGASYHLDTVGSNSCSSGDSPGESDCASAGVSVGGTLRSNALVAGSWGHVPSGCSIQNGPGGDQSPHYNRASSGNNDGGYTPVCTGAGVSYFRVSGSTTCEGAGGVPVTDMATCRAAAAAVGYTYTVERNFTCEAHGASNGDVCTTARPGSCFTHNGELQLFNALGLCDFGNAGDTCLCARSR